MKMRIIKVRLSQPPPSLPPASPSPVTCHPNTGNLHHYVMILTRPAYEGFCEDRARQNIVVSDLAPATVSVSSYMGFSHRRGVLKATI
jgi:hypothetical protein